MYNGARICVRQSHLLSTVNESKWHKVRGGNMNQEMTERIAEAKELVNAAEWREKILSCQESGKPVTV